MHTPRQRKSVLGVLASALTLTYLTIKYVKKLSTIVGVRRCNARKSVPSPNVTPLKKAIVVGLVVLLALSGIFVIAEAASAAPIATAASIPTGGSGAQKVVVTPDGSTAFVLNSGSQNIAVINLSTGVYGAPIVPPSVPSTIAMSPDGAELVVVGGTASTNSYLYLYNAKTFTQMSVNGSSAAPAVSDANTYATDVIVSPDSKTAYVSADLGVMYKIDLTTMTLVGRLSYGATATRLAINPAGTFLFITNSSQHWVEVMNLTVAFGTNLTRISGSFSTPYGVAFNPAGTKAYVTNFGAASVSVIDVATLTASPTTIPTGGYPIAVAFTPDGTAAYVANDGGNTVSMINTTALTATTLAVSVSSPFSVAVAPSGKAVYIANYSVSSLSVLGTAPVFTASTPPNAWSLSSAFSYTYAATGGPVPQFALASGAFPNGLSLNPTTGVLSGTPTVAGVFTFTVTATGASPAAVTPSTTITITSFSTSIGSAEMSAVRYSTSPQTSTGTLTLSTASSGTAGWNVTVQASSFVYSDVSGNAGVNIPASGFLLTGVGTPAMVTGQAVTAGGTDASVTGPQQASISSGVTGTLASTRTILHAGANYGVGSYTQALAVSLAVPASSVIGLYTSTLTVTIASGP